MYRVIIFSACLLGYLPVAFSATSASCGNGTVKISGDDVYLYGGSGDPLPVYGGEHKPIAVASCGTGVVTVFRHKNRKIDWAYYSPDCLKVGGGGKTRRVYDGDHVIVSLSQHPVQGVVATWKKNGKSASYHSPNCLNIGGGGNTARY